jgi:hypothetical protein
MATKRVNDPIEPLTDEQLRALQVLAGYPSGCAETVLLELGFSYDQLGVPVFNGLATMQPSVTHDGGREKMVVWVNITGAGRRASDDPGAGRAAPR